MSLYGAGNSSGTGATSAAAAPAGNGFPAIVCVNLYQLYRWQALDVLKALLARNLRAGTTERVQAEAALVEYNKYHRSLPPVEEYRRVRAAAHLLLRAAEGSRTLLDKNVADAADAADATGAPVDRLVAALRQSGGKSVRAAAAYMIHSPLGPALAAAADSVPPFTSGLHVVAAEATVRELRGLLQAAVPSVAWFPARYLSAPIPADGSGAWVHLPGGASAGAGSPSAVGSLAVGLSAAAAASSSSGFSSGGDAPRTGHAVALGNNSWRAARGSWRGRGGRGSRGGFAAASGSYSARGSASAAAGRFRPDTSDDWEQLDEVAAVEASSAAGASLPVPSRLLASRSSSSQLAAPAHRSIMDASLAVNSSGTAQSAAAALMSLLPAAGLAASPGAHTLATALSSLLAAAAPSVSAAVTAALTTALAATGPSASAVGAAQPGAGPRRLADATAGFVASSSGAAPPRRSSAAAGSSVSSASAGASQSSAGLLTPPPKVSRLSSVRAASTAPHAGSGAGRSAGSSASAASSGAARSSASGTIVISSPARVTGGSVDLTEDSPSRTSVVDLVDEAAGGSPGAGAARGAARRSSGAGVGQKRRNSAAAGTAAASASSSPPGSRSNKKQRPDDDDDDIVFF